ncbi:hypothetical protein E4U11_007648 [Claviceps purpurea]|nr:hypothetical protein E4U11_007648 [Claviceps purpurea]
MNSTLNSRFTEVQFCAKSTIRHKWRHCDVLCLETKKHNVSTRILDQLSGLSDDALDPLQHGDRCMLARAGAGQSDMTASTEYSLGHSVWK